LRAHFEKSAMNDLRFTRIIATALQSIVGIPACDAMFLHAFTGFPYDFSECDSYVIE
jgi:hypothetical protein